MLAEPIRQIRRKVDTIDVFGGYNDTESAKNNEFSDICNLSHDQFPSLVSMLEDFVSPTEYANPNGMISFDNRIYVADGTSFKRDTTVLGTISNSEKCLIEFNKFILIFPDMKYYDTEDNVFGSFANGTIVTDANPVIQRATVHNNRVFGFNGVNVYASKQGDFKEWNVFDGLLTDSWATDVAGADDFVAIGTYQNHVVLQTGTRMFELYGYNPSNFQIQETVKIGAISKEYAEVNSVLYFANPNGIYAYSGGVPRKISENISGFIVKAILGATDKFLYAALYLADDMAGPNLRYKLFRLDTTNGLWTTLSDEEGVVTFLKESTMIAVLTRTGSIKTFDMPTPIVIPDVGIEYQKNYKPFRLITRELREYFGKANIKKVEIHAEMGDGAELAVYIKGDADVDWTLASYFLASTERNLMLPVNVSKNCYKIKIEGRGYVKLNAMRFTSLGGGRI
jgi:hypothetical protein